MELPAEAGVHHTTSGATRHCSAKETPMRKLVLGLITGSAAGLALTAAPQPAQAQGLLGALLGLGSPTFRYGFFPYFASRGSWARGLASARRLTATATLPTTAPGTRGVDRSPATTLIARTGTSMTVIR